MPELPDLQVFSQNLTRRFAGQKLQSVRVPYTKKLKVSEQTIQDTLQGSTLQAVVREGKELYWKFSNNHVLALHLMLKGQLFAYTGQHTHKYPIIELDFEKESFTMTDFQGQATPTLDPEYKDAPDALSDQLDVAWLYTQLQRSRSSIKNILLDQHILRGIGNAYADEILWAARIAPTSIAKAIPEAQVGALVKGIRDTLQHAITHIRQHHPDIISGEVRDFLLIHNSKKKTSPDGAPIEQTTINGRKTYYTDEQVVYS